jgi:uncharacterized protein (TIGR02145 family)
MKILVLITATVFIIQICNAQTGTVTDIDGNVYNTVRIGNQVWMKENLKTTHYRNGDSIGTTYPATLDYSGESTPKYQWVYDDKDSLAAIYGRLYTWYAAIDSRNVCPTGWHVPADSEWTTLTNFLGGESAAFGKLKETDTLHWNNPNTDATNEVGFTALPGGSHWADGSICCVGMYGHWWTATSNNTEMAWRRALTYDGSYKANFRGTADKTNGWSLRCVEDPIPDSAKYFGQTPPGDTAIMFAPEISSLPNLKKTIPVFSPDGNECYYGAEKIYFTKRINNIWIDQEEASFSIGHNAGAQFFSADGNTLYFNYWNTDGTNNHVWMVERTKGGWSNPQLLPLPINSTSADYSFTETADSVDYIASNRPGGLDSYGDIWRISRSSDQSLKAENLGSTVNSTSYDCDPCVARDGSYLIFSSVRPGGYGNQDLYICFNKGNREWTAPVNMERSGAKINISQRSQVSPSLSPDGKFLFFFRHNDLATISDIYWVSTHIIDTLKKIAMPTTVVYEAKTENLIKVFPNPSNGVFTITLASDLAKNATAEIFLMDGKMAIRQTIWNKSETIDLADYAKGIYILKITTDSKIFTQKISLK